ncbi:hypothetical protein D3C80_1924700 [compost metagenome]
MGDENLRAHAADDVADLKPYLHIVRQLAVGIVQHNRFPVQLGGESLRLPDLLRPVLRHLLPGRHTPFTRRQRQGNNAVSF